MKQSIFVRLMAWGMPVAALTIMAMPAPALAAPGLGNEVYGATVEAHAWELETRYGALSGGSSSGEENSRIELAYGVSKRLRVATVIEFEKDPGGKRKATHLGFEAVVPIGRIAGLDIAGYAEYEIGLNGTQDSTEAKLLIERRTGHWDTRFNLIGEKPLRSSDLLHLSYALSINRSVAKNVRLGVTGFGDLGTFSQLLPNAEHYLGPEAQFRIPVGDRDGDGDGDRGLSIRAGYLFPLGTARADSKGQFRLSLEFEY